MNEQEWLLWGRIGFQSRRGRGIGDRLETANPWQEHTKLSCLEHETIEVKSPIKEMWLWDIRNWVLVSKQKVFLPTNHFSKLFLTCKVKVTQINKKQRIYNRKWTNWEAKEKRKILTNQDKMISLVGGKSTNWTTDILKVQKLSDWYDFPSLEQCEIQKWLRK
jgi:hypothetical protein